MTKSARARFSASGSWRARICVELRLGHARAAPAPVRAAPRAGRRRRSPCRTPRRRRFRTARECRTASAGASPLLDDEARALMVDRGVDDRLERGQLVAIAEHRGRRARRDRPRRRASCRGSAPRSRATSAPPGPCSRRTSASASKTGMPASANIAATVDLPMPIDPVSASVIIACSLCQSSASWSRGASSPKKSLKLVAACSTSMSRPSTAASPRVAGRLDAAACRRVGHHVEHPAAGGHATEVAIEAVARRACRAAWR